MQSSESSASEPIESSDGMWLLKYDLSNDDKLAIGCRRPLTTNIVNAAIDIMHSEYPNLGGLKSLSILPDLWGKGLPL